MKQAKVINAIVDGEFTEAELRAIAACCWDTIKGLRRQKMIQNVATLVPGTRVRITEGIKPRYMVGHTGVVVENGGSRAKAGYVWIDTGKPIQGRTRSWGSRVLIPANCLEEVK